jgi:hypothetical protein
MYTSENYYLAEYLKAAPVDIARNWSYFLDWGGSEEILERLGIEKDVLEEQADSGEDTFYEMCDQIEKNMTDEEKGEFGGFIANRYPSEAPTWTHVSLEKYRLPRQTWLIHFSNQARQIREKGFTHGVFEVDRLALTTWLHENEKKYGGYNFAFVAGGRDSLKVGRSSKYGNNAVMFQSSGVEIYHYGDEENQVIFWGKTVDPNTVVYLRHDDVDEWLVVTGSKASQALKGRGAVYVGNLENVILWVKQNWQQYRRQIFGKRCKQVV